MKTLLLATTALMLTAPAFAADLAPRAMEPVAPAYIAPQAFNWTGFYAGVNAGYGFSADFGASGIDSADGFTGGAQAGYNMQFNPLVVGIEGEIDYADISDRFGSVKADLNWRSWISAPGFAIIGSCLT